MTSLAPHRPLPPSRVHAVAARNVSFKGAAVTVLAPRNDEYVGGSILATGAPFEPDTLGYMLDHVKQGSTVVDAGWWAVVPWRTNRAGTCAICLCRQPV